MWEFIAKILGRDGGSKGVAKERLRLVLVHDRSSTSPQLIENMRADIIKVISNYMEIDEDALEMSIDSKGDTMALIANIPVKGMKRTAGNAL